VYEEGSGNEMTDTNNTIPAPAHEHNKRCRHTDCVGECCEPCANMPKAEARRPKVGDCVVNLVGGRCGGFRVSYVNRDCLEAKTGDGGATAARIIRTIDSVGVTWDFDEPATKQPDDLTERECEALAEQLFKDKAQAQIASLEDFAGLVIEERDELKARNDKLFRTLSQVQAERTAAYAERDELARKLEGAKAEGRRELASQAFDHVFGDEGTLTIAQFRMWLCEKVVGR
jgi:hypothetical protein